MADNVRDLIATVYEYHRAWLPAGEICVSCNSRWPCLPHRLADALITEHNKNRTLQDTIEFLDEKLHKVQDIATAAAEWGMHRTDGCACTSRSGRKLISAIASYVGDDYD